MAAKLPDILVNHEGLVNGQLGDISGPAGGTFTYRAKVKLQVGNPVVDVQMTEVLPAGAIFQSIESSPEGIVCTPPAGQTVVKGTPLDAQNNSFSCKIDTLAQSDGFKWVDFNVILPEVRTDWLAKASAQLPAPIGTEDDDPSNNVDLERNFTTSEASDLAIQVSTPGTNGIVTNGGAYNYQIDVSNQGPSIVPAEGKLQVSFEVPAGAIVSATPTGSGWSCSPGGQQNPGTKILCDYKVPKGAGVPVATALPPITIPAIANMGGTIGASASVEGFGKDNKPLADGQKGNNTDSANVTSDGPDFADMSLSKSVNKQQVDAHEGAKTQVVYTLTPKREGGSITPANVTVVDQLPAGVSFVSTAGTDARWACSHDVASNQVSCVWNGEFNGGLGATMPPIKITADIVAPANAMAQGTVVNNAKVELPGSNEPNLTNNEAKAPVTFSNKAQLALNKSGPSRPVKKGTTFQYNLSIRNNGPMDVLQGQAMTVTEKPVAPLMLIGISQASIDAGWVCPTLPAAAGVQVECSNSSGLAANQSVPLVFDAKVDDMAAGDEYVVVKNNATAGIAPGDRESTPVNASRDVTVSNSTADLVVGKTVVSPLAGPIKSGDTVTYKLSVTNSATSTQTATDITLTDRFQNLVIKADGTAIKGDHSSSAYPQGGYLGYESVGGVSVTCKISGNENDRNRNFTCEGITLAPGETAAVMVKIIPRVNVTGEYANTVDAYSSKVNDSDIDNNTATAKIQLEALTDLTVDKQVSPLDAVAAGQPATYKVSVQNLGPSSAQKVVMVDTLPANAYLIGEPQADNGGTCKFQDADGKAVAKADGMLGGTMTCEWTNDLSARSQYLVSYKARSKGDAPEQSTMENKVAVSTSTPETNYNNNTDEVSIALKPAELDMQILMLHSDDGLAFGEETEYSIVIKNDGSSASYASNVLMSDLFPAAGSLATFSYQGGLTISGKNELSGSTLGTAGIVCAEPALGSTADEANPAALNCVVPLMAPGDTLTFTFKMKAVSLPDGRATGTIFHSATVKPLEKEYLANGNDVLANNVTTDRTSTYDPAQISPEEAEKLRYVDLSVSKAATSVPTGGISQGDSIGYSLVVKNEEDPNRVDPVTGKAAPLHLINGQALVTDALPEGLELLGDVPAGCNYDAATRTLSCTVTDLEAGKSVSFDFVVQVTAIAEGQTSIANKATLTSPGDPVEPNNEDTEEPPVATLDLALTKQVDKTQAIAGDTLVYTLKVLNHGPATSKGAVVTDVLPEGLEFVSATGNCQFAAPTRTLSCELEDLVANATASIQVSATVGLDVTGPTTLVNSAKVKGPGDTDPTNDEDKVTTTVPKPDPGDNGGPGEGVPPVDPEPKPDPKPDPKPEPEPEPEPEPTPAPTPVPSLGAYSLAFLSLALGVAAMRQRRQR